MTPDQVTAGRRALFPFKDRVKLQIERGDGVAYLIPYRIDRPDPEDWGAAVMVSDTTQDLQITRALERSIGALLG